MAYEYHRIERLYENLIQNEISQDIIAYIMEGGEQIKKGSKPAIKADWLRDAMQRMDEKIGPDTRKIIREGCACCLGGQRLQVSKAICRNHPTPEARIIALNEARLVVGEKAIRISPDTYMVQFHPDGLASYRCPCLPHASGKFSATYCQCCGGHVKHHLQTALGQSLDVTLQTSVLTSEGREPCRFILTAVE